MMDETQELALIRAVLVEAFPGESRRVGKSNLNDIVQRRGQVQVAPLSGASRLDWTEALILLSNSAVLLSQWLADHGKAGWSIHLHQVNHVSQAVQVGRIDHGSQVSVGNDFTFSVPPEIAARLDPATLDRLATSFAAHLRSVDVAGSDAREPA
jgi:hypothetical protein